MSRAVGIANDLVKAVEGGQKEEAERISNELLANGKKLNSVDYNGRTAIMYAAKNGHDANFQMLMDKDADLTVIDYDGRTATMYAAEEGHDAIVQMLTDNVVDLNVTDVLNGRTAVMMAVKNGHDTTFQILMDKGADLTVIDYCGKTALDYAKNDTIRNVIREHDPAEQKRKAKVEAEAKAEVQRKQKKEEEEKRIRAEAKAKARAEAESKAAEVKRLQLLEERHKARLVKAQEEAKAEARAKADRMLKTSANSFTVFGKSITLHKNKGNGVAVAIPGILFGHFLGYAGKEIPVVLKLAQMTDITAASVCRDLTRESDILLKLQELKVQAVVRMYEFNTTHSPMYLVLKKFGTSMETFMKSNNLETRKSLALKLALAVGCIHDVGLMHGDLKPSNVLVHLDSGGGVELKLTDFDSARFINEGPASLYPHDGSQLKYTAAWVGGPEVLFGTGGHLQASLYIDLFALGLVLAVMLRPQCVPGSTALPTEQAKLRKLLCDEAALFAHLRCGGLTHACIVQRLCSFTPEHRGTTDDAIAGLRIGATVLQPLLKATKEEIQLRDAALANATRQNQFLQKKVIDGQDKVIVGVSELKMGQEKILKVLKELTGGLDHASEHIIAALSTTFGEHASEFSGQVLGAIAHVNETLTLQQNSTGVAACLDEFKTEITLSMKALIDTSTVQNQSGLQTMSEQVQNIFTHLSQVVAQEGSDHKKAIASVAQQLSLLQTEVTLTLGDVAKLTALTSTHYAEMKASQTRFDDLAKQVEDSHGELAASLTEQFRQLRLYGEDSDGNLARLLCCKMDSICAAVDTQFASNLPAMTGLRDEIKAALVHQKEIGDQISLDLKNMQRDLLLQQSDISTKLSGVRDFISEEVSAFNTALKELPTHADLRAMSEQMQGTLREFALDGLKEVAASTSDSMRACVEEAIAQQERALKPQFDQLTMIVEKTGDLNSRQLKRENENVLAAVNAIQSNMSVLADKVDWISHSMSEVNTELLFENFEHLLETYLSQSEESLEASLGKLLETKLEEMESMLESSAVASDTNLQHVMKDVIVAIEKVDLHDVVEDIAAKVDAVRSVQNDLVYGVHEIPLLPVISRLSKNTLKTKCKGVFCDQYNVRFLCTVCGQPAESGPKGEGLTLSVPKKGLTQFVECLSLVLLAIEFAGVLAGAPVPRFGALMKSIAEAVPEEVLAKLTTATEQLSTFTRENDLGSLVDDLSAGGGDQKQAMPQRPTVALRQVKLLRVLLAALGDKDCEKTGLEKAIRIEDGACTWVCSAAKSGNACYETFLKHGRAALLIDVALV